MRIVVAARTAPNRSVRFGGDHDAVDARGLRDAAELRAQLSGVHAAVGPELSVRQTAEAAGCSIVEHTALHTLNVGRWRGRGPEEIPGAELAAWFADPAWSGHGGESVAEFVDRIAAAAHTVVQDTVVVAGPVAQALLCSDAGAFFAVQVRPAGTYRRGNRPAGSPR